MEQNIPVTQEQPKKPWYKSRTIQIAIIQAVIGIVVIFATQYPAIGWISILKSVLDVALRFYTVLPVE